MMDEGHVSSSFRDPSGFMFYREGRLYRQVNLIYKEHYDHLFQSGLYDLLVSSDLLIPHREVEIPPEDPVKAYKIILPVKVPFISYPYEWSFGQLRDAALTTLKIQRIALNYNMTLKDASAFNIQFIQGKPILIDTLSFEAYRNNEPWVGYSQFCRHFLAPLLLMRYLDGRLNKLMINFIDGIPLDITKALLPKYSFLKFGTLAHIYLQAKAQSFAISRQLNSKKYRIEKHSLISILDNLSSLIRKLKFKLPRTEWAGYYGYTNYSAEGMLHKEKIIRKFLDKIRPTYVWDVGANDGTLSRIASEMGIFTICLDNDPFAVEMNYRTCLKNGETNIFPLLIDLTNPTPPIGWGNRERLSLLERGPTDTLLALALIHHLAISHNLPLSKLAGLFSKLCKSLIIEFVPKHDSQVQRMLANRDDIFSDYTQENFEYEFSKYFTIRDCLEVIDSERSIYLMTNNNLLL